MKITHALIFMFSSLFLVSTNVMANTLLCKSTPQGFDIQLAFVVDEGSGIYPVDTFVPMSAENVSFVVNQYSVPCADNDILLQTRRLVPVSRIASSVHGLTDNVDGVNVGFGGVRGLLPHMIPSVVPT